MPYQIPPDLSDALVAEPEYGMGYQLATVRPADRGANHPDRFAIINASWALRLPEPGSFDPVELQPFDRYITDLATTSAGPGTRVLVHQPIDIPDVFPYTRDEMELLSHGSFPARVSNRQRFARFTAFVNDRRILDDASVVPGTYITSANDTDHVNTGLGAVARYALPFPAPAIYRFDITIHATRPVTVMCGNVEPAYNQSGGGIEFQLPNEGQHAVASREPKTLPAW